MGTERLSLKAPQRTGVGAMGGWQKQRNRPLTGCAKSASLKELPRPSRIRKLEKAGAGRG
jgi:hypothetical protein